MTNRIFLGGTCNNSTWRDKLIPMLSHDYFNPVVENWTPADKDNEIDERRNKCNVHLYHITSDMTGVYSIAEMVESAMLGFTTIVTVETLGFDKSQINSFKATLELIGKYGAHIAFVESVSEINDLINQVLQA